MLSVNEYLPIGSIVLLKGGFKKAMIIGIIHATRKKDGEIAEYDYIAVMYPEGFLNTSTMFLFNHDQITDVIYRGYENPERKDFLDKLEEKVTLVKEMIEKKKSLTNQPEEEKANNTKKHTPEDIF